jgi:hypothetical protein
MPALGHLLRNLLLGCLVMAGSAAAHQVPSMTIEAAFARDRSFVLRINFDPRLFLSDQPATLPPVPAAWYLDQSPAEVQRTIEDARTYLRKNLQWQFGSETIALPELEILPINGANNQPLTPVTEEVHLLASGRSVIPVSGGEFKLGLGREANVGLILLNRMEGQKDPTPAVIFPGETSQPFKLVGVMSLEEALARLSPSETRKTAVSVPWLLRGAVSLLVLVVWIVSRRKRLSTRRIIQR